MPTEDQQRLLEKERLRYRVLKTIYDASDGSRRIRLFPKQISEATGLSLDEAESALEYLDAEGLTRIDSEAGARSIQHRGVVEIERTIRHPDQGTDHFSAEVVIEMRSNAPTE